MWKASVRATGPIWAGAIVFCAGGTPSEDFAKDIQPILSAQCYKCHGADKKKADLNLEKFTNYDQIIGDQDSWQTVLERVQAFEMPPPPERGLSFAEEEKMLGWLRGLPHTERTDCEKIASDRTSSYYHGYVMSRRLNRAEYNNTLRDLLGLELQLEELLPADGGGGEGFDTSGNALFVSSIHIEKYLAAAEQALSQALPDKPRTPAARKARDVLLTARPGILTSPRNAAKQVVSAFAARAFRRPVESEEVERFLALFDRAYRRGDGYVSSVRQVLKGVLVSPNFLFLAEPEPEVGGVQRLAVFPLASRLSYFIWSSMPDAELFRLAKSGELLDTNIYRQQIHRLLADPRAAALGERFGLQWLNLDRLGTEVRPDAKSFPEFDAALGSAMHKEAVLFFNHIIQQDRSLMEFIDADYTFVNEPLARLYGITGVSGPEFRRIDWKDHHRGGVLGMAAVHTLTSFPTRTSPVLRGKWVMETLLGEKVNPPPPDVPALDEAAGKVSHTSLRSQLEAHRSKPECASCHDKMDPLGFGLENFDAVGRWREEDRGQPIDARGKLSSGKTFTGPEGLKQILLERKEQILRVLVRKMTGYAFGRELNQFDDCVVNKAMTALQQNNWRASLLVEQIATSYPFQHRFYPTERLAYEKK